MLFSKEDIMVSYFKWGFTYKNILLMCERYHGIEMSIRTLKHIFKQLGCPNKGKLFSASDVHRIEMAIDS